MCKEFAQQFVIHPAELHAHLEDLAFLSSLTLKVPTVPKPEVRPCCSRLTLYTPSPTQPQIHTNTGAHTFISHMLPSDMVPACLFGLFYDHNQQPDRHSAFQQAHPTGHHPEALHLPRTPRTPLGPLLAGSILNYYTEPCLCTMEEQSSYRPCRNSTICFECSV